MPRRAHVAARPFETRAPACAALLGACLALGSPAAAAPPPTLGGGGSGPEEQACAGRAVGDACTLPNQQLGTCGQGTCNRLDYSQGSPPKAIEESCVVCQPGGGHGDPPALGSGGAPPDDGGGGGDEAAGGDGPASTSNKEPPESSSRCSVVPETGPPVFALLALLGALGHGVRRRRRATP